jgi:hypothetical protein
VIATCNRPLEPGVKTICANALQAMERELKHLAEAITTARIRGVSDDAAWSRFAAIEIIAMAIEAEARQAKDLFRPAHHQPSATALESPTCG